MPFYDSYSYTSDDYTDSDQSSDGPVCEHCGCTTGWWPGGNPKRYCDLECRTAAVKGELCLFCGKAPKWMDPELKRPRDFCGTACRKKAFDQGPILLEVDRDSRAFQSVRDQFRNSWRHANKDKPTLVRLFKVISHRETHKRYVAYREEIENLRNFSQRGTRQVAGNERRRFHGTERRCQIGDPRHPTAKFCKSPHCRVCAILRTSFDISRSGQYANFSRFGKAIYTTSTSSKADDYSRDLASNYNAYILAKVVMGQPYTAYWDDPNRQKPPPGCDSVLGQPGGALNYDEAVVYDEDAVRPLYLLICER